MERNSTAEVEMKKEDRVGWSDRERERASERLGERKTDYINKVKKERETQRERERDRDR